MKKLLLLPVMLLAISLNSCKKEVPLANEEYQVTAVADRPGINPLVAIFRKCDHWTITQFSLNGNQYTDEFDGYRLQFCPNNTVTFSNTIYGVAGTWYSNWSDAGAYRMALYFSVPERLPDPLWGNLEGTWRVVKARNNYLRFEIVRGDYKVLEIERVLDRDAMK